MINKTLVFAGLVSAGCLAGLAHADDNDNYDGVVTTPFDVGGLQFVVSMPSMKPVPANIGQTVGTSYKIPFARDARMGCFLGSVALSVGHHDGQGFYIPDLHVTWQGMVFTHSGVWPNVFRIELEIKSADGTQRTVSSVTTAGQFPALTPLFYPTPDTVIYRGDFDQTLNSTNLSLLNTSVREDDEIHVKVCDLAATSSMTVRHMVLQTNPFVPPPG